MTDGLLVLVAVGGVAVVGYVLHRWGWPWAVAVVTGAVSIVAVFWRREDRPLELEDPVTDEAETQARAANERQRQASRELELEALVKLEDAQERAAAIAGMSDEELLAYANRRAERGE